MTTAVTFDTASLKDIFPAESQYSKNLEWVSVAGATLLGFGHEPLIRSICELIVKETEASGDGIRLQALRKLREALLKVSPLVGFPRSINGLQVFRQAIEDLDSTVAKKLEADKSLREPVSLEARQKRGKEFFSKIYAQHTERVLQNLNVSSGGDLGEFAINCIYGDLVAETSILDAKETGLLEFVCCLCLGASSQAKGHMYGSHNLGNTGAEITGARRMVETIAGQLHVPWNDFGMTFLDTPTRKGW